MEGKLATVSKNILKYLYAVSPCPLRVRRWLASKKDDICFVKSVSDVSGCESGLRSLLTSSPVVTPCWFAMVSMIIIGVSMYGAKFGNVVRRMSVLAAPMLARRAVVRVLLAKVKSLCLVVAKRWILTTAEAALLV
jgi:hypothetical protein